jgi:hypothetical protein
MSGRAPRFWLIEKRRRAIQGLRFGKLGDRLFRVAMKSVSGGEVGANEWDLRVSGARLFELQNCLFDM